MQKSKFTDLVVQALTVDVSVLDSLTKVAWNGAGDALLLRVQPVNQKAWREIGKLIVDRLRDLAQRLSFKARLQMLNVNGERNLIFQIKPIKNNKQPKSAT